MKLNECPIFEYLKNLYSLATLAGTGYPLGSQLLPEQSGGGAVAGGTCSHKLWGNFDRSRKIPYIFYLLAIGNL